jgi:hypothetical protein
MGKIEISILKIFIRPKLFIENYCFKNNIKMKMI